VTSKPVKRGSLSSDLLGATRAAKPEGEKSLRAAEPAAPVCIDPIPEGIVPVREERPAELLVGKGAASARAFKPATWTYERQDRPQPEAPSVKPKEEPASGASEPEIIARKPAWRRASIALLCGCVLIGLFAAGRFASSRLHSAEFAVAPPETHAGEVSLAAPPPALPAAAPTAPHAIASAAPAPAAPTPASSEPASSQPEAAAAKSESASAPPMSSPPASTPAIAALGAADQAAPTAAPKPPKPPQPSATAASAISPQEAEQLLARGDELLGTGDVFAARLYYEEAADAGNRRAALLMGATFDPEFLSRAGVRGLRGDREMAAMWYRRARDLGEPDAARLLDGLNRQ